MNAPSNQWKPRLLIGGMAILALCINHHFLGKVKATRIQERQEQQSQMQAAADQKAAQAVAAEHARYVARYVSTSSSPKNGHTVAVVAATEDGKLNSAITAALAGKFQKDARILSAFFTPDFISDGLFNDAFAGNAGQFQTLDLTNAVDVVVLARQDVQYSQSAALDNVITATMRLDVVAVPVAGKSDRTSWSFTAFGPGFSKEVARGAAEDRIIKQIAADTKMSLK